MRSFMDVVSESLGINESIPRESDKKEEKEDNKGTVNWSLHSGLMDDMLKSFETIPRQDKTSKEDAAIADIKEMVQYLEKQVKGTLQESDKQKIRQKKESYKASIEILSGILLKSM
ncbi:MAG TPA: hypothetical protein IAB46_13815 [Candidatus Scybalocola faecigallinarum]|uniref:Uncharacterized protein n=1 Tax=Candidatus Scybalocola faecigallinarum TaxID=2840941 RepID=A0A9D1JSR5_9FIRM|nr:hypothetical protein [Candidatus Scybalocola faecigallinarum]